MEQKKQIKTIKQFLKKIDLNLESAINKIEENQDVEMFIDIDVKKLKEDIYDVTLKIKSEIKKIFLCEVHYAGLFQLEQRDEEEKEEILLAFCPTLLFPYVRQLIHSQSSISLPFPIMIDHVDFYHLYQKRRLQGNIKHNKTEH
jgi:preprotein translocase subunit SecB